jgi:hypothetical protein
MLSKRSKILFWIRSWLFRVTECILCWPVSLYPSPCGEKKIRKFLILKLTLTTTINLFPPSPMKLPYQKTIRFEYNVQNRGNLAKRFSRHERHTNHQNKQTNKQTSWSESAIELYRQRDRRLSAKLVPAFAARGCHVVSVTDLYGRILDFLDRSRYFLFQVVPQLYSLGWVDLVPDPLFLRKSGSAENRTRTSGSVARNSDH